MLIDCNLHIENTLISNINSRSTDHSIFNRNGFIALKNTRIDHENVYQKRKEKNDFHIVWILISIKLLLLSILLSMFLFMFVDFNAHAYQANVMNYDLRKLTKCDLVDLYLYGFLE